MSYLASISQPKAVAAVVNNVIVTLSRHLFPLYEL